MSTFESMDLFEPLKKALAEQQYTTPTPIQEQTIPAAVDGQDILGCAQTGTGKTAAFALPILDFIGHEKPKVRPNRPLALVMAPTRELAIQIGDSFQVYGKHVKFRQALVYGGVGQAKQVNALRRGSEVLIATPGRLLDLMDQKHIDLSNVEVFVLDEADRMLDMGFMPALKKIIARLPKERQSLFFSATMPPKIRELASQLLFNPVSVNVTPPKQSSVDKITQSVMMVDRGHKVGLLSHILKGENMERAIVFTRTKHGANSLTRKLEREGLTPAAIHGNKSQNARQKALEAFRQKQVTVLVATDVAARGIDIDGVTHVVNFDMPVEAESYVHRIGRTGRAGAAGIAISFCTGAEREELRAIEKLIGQKIPLEGPPSDFDAKKVTKDSGDDRSSSRGRRPKSPAAKSRNGSKRKPSRGPRKSRSSGKTSNKSTEAASGEAKKRTAKKTTSKRPRQTASIA